MIRAGGGGGSASNTNGLLNGAASWSSWTLGTPDLEATVLWYWRYATIRVAKAIQVAKTPNVIFWTEDWSI